MLVSNFISELFFFSVSFQSHQLNPSKPTNIITEMPPKGHPRYGPSDYKVGSMPLAEIMNALELGAPKCGSFKTVVDVYFRLCKILCIPLPTNSAITTAVVNAMKGSLGLPNAGANPLIYPVPHTEGNVTKFEEEVTSSSTAVPMEDEKSNYLSLMTTVIKNMFLRTILIQVLKPKDREFYSFLLANRSSYEEKMAGKNAQASGSAPVLPRPAVAAPPPPPPVPSSTDLGGMSLWGTPPLPLPLQWSGDGSGSSVCPSTPPTWIRPQPVKMLPHGAVRGMGPDGKSFIEHPGGRQESLPSEPVSGARPHFTRQGNVLTGLSEKLQSSQGIDGKRGRCRCRPSGSSPIKQKETHLIPKKGENPVYIFERCHLHRGVVNGNLLRGSKIAAVLHAANMQKMLADIGYSHIMEQPMDIFGENGCITFQVDADVLTYLVCIMDGGYELDLNLCPHLQRATVEMIGTEINLFLAHVALSTMYTYF